MHDVFAEQVHIALKGDELASENLQAAQEATQQLLGTLPEKSIRIAAIAAFVQCPTEKKGR